MAKKQTIKGRGGKGEGDGRKQTTPDLKPIERTIHAPNVVNVAHSGVLILALGHPYYGEMAFNLAATLKASDRNINIHVVHTDNSLSYLNEAQKALFNSTSLCPVDAITKGNKQDVYFKAKTFIYDLSPFEETLFLDADIAWLYQKSITDFIVGLSANCDFTMQNKGLNYSQYLWANHEEIKAKYPDGELYNLYSEMIFFKKNEANKLFFDTSKKFFDNPTINSSVIFNDDIADELAFALAMLELKHYPHQKDYKPIFWFLSDGKQGSSIQHCLDKGYYGYSAGGNSSLETVKEKYEMLIRGAVSIINVGPAFKLKSKKQFLIHRKNK